MSKFSPQYEALEVVRKNIVDLYKETKNLEIVHNLLSSDINCLGEKSLRGQTLFHYAAEKGDLDLFNVIFEEIDLAIFSSIELSYNQTISHYTNLGRYISEVEANSVRREIESSVKAESNRLVSSLINSFDEQGRTPASIAAKNFHVEMVSAFQDHGADITLSASGSPSAFSHLVQSPKKSAGILAVKYAVVKGAPASITYEEKLGLEHWARILSAELRGVAHEEAENHAPEPVAAAVAGMLLEDDRESATTEPEDDAMGGYESPPRSLFSDFEDAAGYQANNLNLGGAADHDNDF